MLRPPTGFYSWAQRAALVLLVAACLLLLASAAVDLRERRSSPEAVARNYFAALEAGDAEAAMDAIAPEARVQWTEFVENGVGNTYRVRGVAVHEPSLLAQWSGEPGLPTDITVFLDITEAVDGVEWQADPQVPLVHEAGRWYLAKPPLA